MKNWSMSKIVLVELQLLTLPSQKNVVTSWLSPENMKLAKCQCNPNFWIQATFLQQSAEWGLREIQGSFPRLKDRLLFSESLENQKVFFNLITMLLKDACYRAPRTAHTPGTQQKSCPWELTHTRALPHVGGSSYRAAWRIREQCPWKHTT